MELALGSREHRTLNVGFVEGVTEFVSGKNDVGKVNPGLDDFDAGEDEIPVVGRKDKPFGVSFGKEAVFTLLDVIAVMSYFAGERFAVFG